MDEKTCALVDELAERLTDSQDALRTELVGKISDQEQRMLRAIDALSRRAGDNEVAISDIRKQLRDQDGERACIMQTLVEVKKISTKLDAIMKLYGAMDG